MYERRILARHKRKKCLTTGREELSWLSVCAPKWHFMTSLAKNMLGYQVAKHFLCFLCVSRQNTESGISGRRKFLATFKSVSPKYTFRTWLKGRLSTRNSRSNSTKLVKALWPNSKYVTKTGSGWTQQEDLGVGQSFLFPCWGNICHTE